MTARKILIKQFHSEMSWRMPGVWLVPPCTFKYPPRIGRLCTSSLTPWCPALPARIKTRSENPSGDVNKHSGRGRFTFHTPPESLFTSARNPQCYYGISLNTVPQLLREHPAPPVDAVP